MPTEPRNRRDFHIAIFCALPLEAENVRSVFDRCWEDEDKQFGKAVGDQNAYTTGVIGDHNVVLVHMARMGGNSASLAAAGLRSSFTEIQLALVVGICGVVPIHPKTGKEIVLGDVIISTAVVQYDFGRQYHDGFERKKEVDDSVGPANTEVRAYLSRLETRQNRRKFEKSLEDLIHSEEFQNEVPAAVYPGANHDRLYEASYVHQHRSNTSCSRRINDPGTCSRTCDELGCGSDMIVVRNRHNSSYVPCVHLGRFGSGNTVMKSGLDRDRIAAADDLVAFEMEGAGVWEQYPTVIIKAACDYADSHKDKRWQSYAAATAAASLKIFLMEWAVTDRSDTSEPIWLCPFLPLPGFIGREAELDSLQKKLLDPNSLRIVSLLGLGGVGKSRLALEFASSMKHKRSIFWVQASDRSTFAKDVLEIGKALKIPGVTDEKADVVMLVKQHLSRTTLEEWLLILDNADDEVIWGRRGDQLSLVDSLPMTTNGSILITTRTRRVASFLAQKEVIQLNAMGENHAAKLFESGLECPDLVTDEATLLVLVEKLSYLPLAIVQAASFINMTQQSLQTYLGLLKKSETNVIKLLSKDFGDPSRYPNAINPVAGTWLVTFNHIQKYHPLAAELLSSMACFHEKGIPRSLLGASDQELDEIDMVEAIAVLTGYSFVTKQRSDQNLPTEEMYDMHRLVQLAARNWLKIEGKFLKCMEMCVRRIDEIFPTSNYSNKSLWTTYMPHAGRVCEPDEWDIPRRYDLLEKIAQCSLADGKYHDAVQSCRAVVEWRESTLDPLHLKTFVAYNSLGYGLYLEGNLSEAEIYLRKAAGGFKAGFGRESAETISNLGALALVLTGQGKYVEAEKISREQLSLSETTMGNNHSSTQTSASILVQVLLSLGKYDEAEEQFRRVVKTVQAMEGENKLLVLKYKSDLARVLCVQGKYNEAEEIYRETVQRNQEIFNRGHPDTLFEMSCLAGTLIEQEEYVEAQKLMQEVLKLNETTLGSKNPQLHRFMGNLARALDGQGELLEAEKVYREVLQELPSEGNQRLRLSFMNNLASVLLEQKRYVEAERLQREQLQLSKAMLGFKHHDTLISTCNLAVILMCQSRHQEAIPLMADCAKKLLEVVGLEHRSTVFALKTLRNWRGQVILLTLLTHI